MSRAAAKRTGTRPQALARRIFDATVEVVERALTFSGPADRVLSAGFRAQPWLGQADRSLIADVLFEVLRCKPLLQHLAESSSPRKLALCALVSTGHANADRLEGAISKAEAAWIREWTDRWRALAVASLELPLQLSLPEWIVESLREDLDDGAIIALGQSLLQPAPLDLRVNLLKARRDDVLDQLRDAGFDAAPTRYAPTGIRLAGKPPINRHPLFLEGKVEVQDEGSQLLPYLLAPKRGEMIVDFCAGAGGKTLAISALMQSTGRVYAFDVSDRRLANLRPRLARSGASNIHPQRIESERDIRIKRLAGKIDRVLVDAPCSGFGTLRRNPDLKWRIGEAAIGELAGKQAAIVEGAARLVKAGGRLVYATCSFLRRENEAIVEGLVRAHPDFEVVDAAEVLNAQGIGIDRTRSPYLRLWPHQHGTDGFFAAVLHRKPSPAPKTADPDKDHAAVPSDRQ